MYYYLALFTQESESTRGW